MTPNGVLGGAEGPTEDTTTVHWCIKRIPWLTGLCGGFIFILILLGVVGFGLALTAFLYPIHIFRQELHTQDGPMAAFPLNHYCSSSNTAVDLTLPNDLTAYIGKMYSFDCDGVYAHTLAMLPGSLATSWTGTIGVRTVTCSTGGGGPSPGITFLVVSSSRVRIIQSTGVTLS